MTTRILRLDSSIFGDQGASSRINQMLIERLQQKYPNATLVHRDLARSPLPHFSGDYVAALNKAPEQRSESEIQAVQLADQLIGELFAADVVVVAAPMYNFGIPSTLKAWIDYVARAGVTFRYTDSGPEGLVKGKPLYIVTTRGGIYKDLPTDVEVPYLQTLFKFIGFEDIRVIYAEGLAIGRAEQQFAEAANTIESLVEGL